MQGVSTTTQHKTPLNPDVKNKILIIKTTSNHSNANQVHQIKSIIKFHMHSHALNHIGTWDKISQQYKQSINAGQYHQDYHKTEID